MPQYPCVVKRLSPTHSTIVILSPRVLDDDASLREHVENLAVRSGCEHRIEYADTQHACVTPQGIWHDVSLWHGVAQSLLRGQVLAIDWHHEVVVVGGRGKEVVVELGTFLPTVDALSVGDEVELLWTVQEGVSGLILE